MWQMEHMSQFKEGQPGGLENLLELGEKIITDLKFLLGEGVKQEPPEPSLPGLTGPLEK
jgi:hypothetical protein